MSGGWFATVVRDVLVDGEVGEPSIHVHPVSEVHQVAGGSCWCAPEVEVGDDGPPLVRHRGWPERAL